MDCPGLEASLVLKGICCVNSVRLKWIALAALATAGCFSVAAANAESLHEALGAAYRTNPTLGAERARQRATDEQVPQALSGWRPQVTASASAATQKRRSKSIDFLGNAGGYNTSASSPGTLNIQLVQPIYQGGRTIASTKAAEANVRAGRQQLLSTEQDILFRTVQAYMNVIRDRQIASLRLQNIKVLRDQLRATRLRFQVGEVTRTDVAQSESRVSQSVSAEASARAQLAASIASYVNLTGHQPSKLSMPRIPRLPRSLESALHQALDLNPNILAAAQVSDAAMHNIDIARSELLPSLSVQASATITDDWEVRTGNTRVGRIESVLNVPIWDGGRTYSSIREAKQTENQRRIEVIEASRQVRESVTSSWNFQISSRDAITAAKAQVSAAQQALSGVREEYLVGSRSTLDVLNAQQELLNARISLVTAERDYIVASYQVLGTIGKLTAPQLALRVPYYDPKVNYNRVRNKLFGAGIDQAK
jgi:outer membrane protein